MPKSKPNPNNGSPLAIIGFIAAAAAAVCFFLAHNGPDVNKAAYSHAAMALFICAFACFVLDMISWWK